MISSLTTFAAEGTQAAETATQAVAWQPEFGKAIMVAIAMALAAFSLGMIGSNYMKALGRNPEAGKAAGQIIIIAAMVEVTALLTIGALFLI